MADKQIDSGLLSKILFRLPKVFEVKVCLRPVPNRVFKPVVIVRVVFACQFDHGRANGTPPEPIIPAP